MENTGPLDIDDDNREDCINTTIFKDGVANSIINREYEYYD